MINHNIFIPQTSQNSLTQQIDDNKEISGKLTYTTIVESIPENKLEKPIKDWEKIYATEWRWRFMKDKERHIVEISQKSNKAGSDRLYFNKYGQWAKENFLNNDNLNNFIVKEYYVYTDS